MKIHWLKNRVTFFATVFNDYGDCVTYVKVAKHAYKDEAELQDLVKRHPGLAYVVQTRRLEMPT